MTIMIVLATMISILAGFVVGYLARELWMWLQIRREKKRLERIIKRYDELMAAMFEPGPE